MPTIKQILSRKNARWVVAALIFFHVAQFALPAEASGRFDRCERLLVRGAVTTAFAAAITVYVLPAADARPGSTSTPSRSSTTSAPRTSVPSIRSSTAFPTHAASPVGSTSGSGWQSQLSGAATGRFGGVGTKAAARSLDTRIYHFLPPSPALLLLNQPRPTSPLVQIQDQTPKKKIFSPKLIGKAFKMVRAVRSHLKSRAASSTGDNADQYPDQYLDQYYDADDIGAQELDETPDDVQAELRLLQTRDTNALPADPRLLPVAPSEAAWAALIQPLQNQLESLDQKLAAAHSAIARNLEHDRALEDVVRSQNVILSLGADISRNAEALADKQKLLFLANEAMNQADEDLRRATAASWTCWIFGDGRLCGWATHATRLARDHRADAVMSIQAEVASLKFKAQVLEQKRNARVDFHAKKVRLATESAPLDRLPNPQLGTLAENLKTQIAAVEDQLRAKFGFVPSSLPGNAACTTPLLYRSLPSVQTKSNPLLGDVSSDLTPDAQSELRVCLDGKGQLAQVHITKDGRDLFHSDVTRGADGHINDIVIFNENGSVLEDHRWTIEDDGSVRYTLSFRTGADDDEQTIYADIPRDEQKN